MMKNSLCSGAIALLSEEIRVSHIVDIQKIELLRALLDGYVHDTGKAWEIVCDSSLRGFECKLHVGPELYLHLKKTGRVPHDE